MTKLPPDPSQRWPDLRPVGADLPLRDYLAEAWRRREFAITVPLGELRAQNQDTALGQLWHLLNPLLLVGVYFVIFDVILDVSERGGVQNFLAFLLVGVVTFNYTRTAMQSGARMIVKNRNLMQSINFPKVILPISALVTETYTHLFAIPVMWLLLIVTGVRPSFAWLLVVPIIVVQAAFNLGLGMVTARMTFHFRDVEQVLPYALRIWFYMSGVIFPVTDRLIANETLLFVLQLNPMFSIIEMSRAAFIDGRFDAGYWATSCIWALAVLGLGFWFFRRAESEYSRV